MNHWLRWMFFVMVARPLALVVLGLNVRHRERLRRAGPAVVVANHNSHLDVFILMTLYPLRELPRLRPVAARDYFCRNRVLAWFSRAIIGIIPFDRDLRGVRTDPLADIDAALGRGEIVILFPEGSRGEPEKRARFKTGIAHIAARHADVPVVPVFMHGLGKALPRGEALLVPFFVDVFVGAPITWTGERASFMELLTCRMTELAEEGHFEPWA